MKKDMDKLMSRTLLTYSIILCFVFILKIFGMDYFGLDTENKIIVGLNNFILHWHLENIWYATTLYINGFIIMSITCNDNSDKMKKFVLYCMPLFIGFQYLKANFNFPFLFVIIDLLYLFILSLCYIKCINKDKITKCNVRNYWFLVLLINIYQIMSIVTRNITMINQHDNANNFIVNIIINFDYILSTIITYKLYFIKGGKDLWDMVHSSFSDLLNSLKRLPAKLRQSYQDAKPKAKSQEEELANKIYIVLFWLYNVFTVAVVLFVATLNNTFVECIFILTSFWMNKGAFGKPFHLKKASTCFVVSSLSYYALNRLTFKIGISFLVPITLGIALSYVTSKLMSRKENIYLYRGMPLDKFYELIRKVTNNELHIDICKMFYVDKETDVKIAYKFNYSVSNIKKIKQKINHDIKEL